jgi:hypothetical protein
MKLDLPWLPRKPKTCKQISTLQALRSKSQSGCIRMQNKDNILPAQKQLLYRKTSAEIVSEARNSLRAGNVKLVSTRRPITPNVNKRQLYVDVGPAGRPPSAFNLKYLQHEVRALPCLEPIPQERGEEKGMRVARSGSLGTIHETMIKTKLPALQSPPRIEAAGSLENRKFDKKNHSKTLSRDKFHLQNLNNIEALIKLNRYNFLFTFLCSKCRLH